MGSQHSKPKKSSLKTSGYVVANSAAAASKRTRRYPRRQRTLRLNKKEVHVVEANRGEVEDGEEEERVSNQRLAFRRQLATTNPRDRFLLARSRGLAWNQSQPHLMQEDTQTPLISRLLYPKSGGANRGAGSQQHLLSSGPAWHYYPTTTNGLNNHHHTRASANHGELEDCEDSCCCSLANAYDEDELAEAWPSPQLSAAAPPRSSHDCDFGYGSSNYGFGLGALSGGSGGGGGRNEVGLENCHCAIMGSSMAASLNRISGGSRQYSNKRYNKRRVIDNNNIRPTNANNNNNKEPRLAANIIPHPRTKLRSAQVNNQSSELSSQFSSSRNNSELTYPLDSHSNITIPISSIRPTTTTSQDHPHYQVPIVSARQQHSINFKNQIRTMFSAAHLQHGLAYNEEQRKRLGLLGLLPPVQQDQKLQCKAVMNFIENCCQDDLSRYVYLRQLKDFNEHLFYAALMQNVEKLMPLVYTPTVGLACQKFSHIYLRPRGLFITPNDLGRVNQLLANWPEKDVRVIVVTDGERILGLGDLGANGMGISIGKLSLYTALAGIPPKNVLPVCLDTGTNNEFNLKDEFYIGLRQNRIRGEKYDQLVEEFMRAVVERWGRSCLIQFEDFANATAFNHLQKYRNDYCTFNDDIQGTASVCLSGLISAAKQIGRKLSTCSFLFYGAGEANLGTANLLMMAMVEDGATKEEAKERIWLVDSKGLVVSSRQDLTGHKRAFARDLQTPQISDLESIIKYTKPTAIIGASAQGGAFNEPICRLMAEFNQEPIIFALSNPTSKAECTANEAYQWTNGKCVFASGSPFDPVEYNGKTFITGQGNNAYIFPGVGLAAIAAHTHNIPEETFLVAARALSDQLEHSDTKVGLVYPRLNRIREVTLSVATRVLEYFYTERLATFRPEPNDKLEFLKSIQYDTSYDSVEI